jgi:hypothetical protein
MFILNPRIQDRSSRMRTWTGPIHPQGVAQLEEFEKGENLPEEVRVSSWFTRLLPRWAFALSSLPLFPLENSMARTAELKQMN